MKYGVICAGLVSISFRALTPRAIVDLAVRARLAGIEWGGDIHAPHGDLARAGEVSRMTRDAGLAVTSYGSYYTVGQSEDEGLSFARVLDTAVALDAPLIRVWAGNRASADADEVYRRMVADESCRIAAEAARSGVAVAFEFHGGTLTDNTASAAALLAATASAGLRCYWQPPTGWSPEERAAALRVVLPCLANLHVYHWHSVKDRRSLAEGAAEWRSYLATVAANCPDPRWALLEYVRNDDPEQLVADSWVLLHLLAQAAELWPDRSSRISPWPPCW